MPTQNMQLILQGILAVTNNTIQNAPQISTFDFQNPTLGANSLFFDPFFQAPTTSASVPLPATVCYCAIIQNNSASTILGVVFTPVGFSSTEVRIGPGGICIPVFDPLETGDGINFLELIGIGGTAVASVLVAA